MHAAQTIFLRCLAGLFLLALVPLRSGFCHVHPHDHGEVHHEHLVIAGHTSLCDHQHGQSLDAPAIPTPTEEAPPCCSAASRTFTLRPGSELVSSKSAPGTVAHDGVDTIPKCPPAFAYGGSPTAPPLPGVPLSKSQRLRI